MTLLEFYEKFPAPTVGSGPPAWIKYYRCKLSFHQLHRPDPAMMADCRDAIREFRKIHRERMEFRRLNAARAKAPASRSSK
ncbi:MAG: hypothetical protein KIT22_09430 [Verrucomicrobiae bacterium]|nr:hypothetical protein [Verrucomicrobiae bacterium]